MKFNLVKGEKAVFVEETTIKREGKKDITLIKLADPNSYESISLFVDKDAEIDRTIKKGDYVYVEINVYETRFTGMSIVKLSKATV